ncbi:superoxide dismutase [Novosphingobium tardum]|uniref:Superoxide dismutase n=1 Tax=Novosphingobium tardum TaxID=1538021 RepID=A0ABV8RND3_9SPHN
MPIKLIDLPYAEDALSPTISADTLATHHGKHHQAYVTKTNDAIAGTELETAPLEQIIKAAKDKGDKPLFNNSAQTWNHGFYWHSLSPSAQTPSGELADAVARDFGSHEEFAKALQEKGEKHFGSGWVWLASTGGKLSIEESHDAETLALGDALPLLVIDVWEHAYYLDHKNERPKYLKAVIGQHLNWEFAAANLASGKRWTYPA